MRNILIVGGGTAGWLTANYLARLLRAQPAEDSVDITLVESSEIGIIGVGEGTFPSIRGTLSAIGLDEARFIREANATFKQGIRFQHWLREPGASGRDHYFHPFSLPSQRQRDLELLPYWLLGAAGNSAFAEATTLQKTVADHMRAPKRDSDGDWQGRLNYAYHFDAARFATLLAAHGRSLGVRHVLATVDDVRLDETGAIAGVRTREAGELVADLYIDCSGFRAALIGSALGSPFRSARDVLFVDRAVAMQVPYPTADTPIASYTISTAHEAGWTWDIGLHERRGVGYVYSSAHTDDERAERILRDHVGAAAKPLQARQLRFEAGYRPLQWVKNCVAIGLSAGFVEPLESTGIGLIEMGAYLVAHLLPRDGAMDAVARHYNDLMVRRYERIFDFLKLHYCLSRRRDSDFWRDNVDARGIPASLQDQLGMWRTRPPHRLDFVTDVEMFLPASWQYILYGMEYATDLSASRASYPHIEQARREFATIRSLAPHAAADLPDHRALVERLAGRAGAAAVSH